MKVLRPVGLIILLVVIAAGIALHYWEQAKPRRDSIRTLQHFESALAAGDVRQLLDVIQIPTVLQSRTSAEQSEFLVKALRDEISPAGLMALQRQGTFGSLTNLFPTEGRTWAEQAGVNPDDCVAFKLERNGLRSEVVLLRSGETYRVVRCNNVKQLASLE